MLEDLGLLSSYSHNIFREAARLGKCDFLGRADSVMPLALKWLYFLVADFLNNFKRLLFV